MKPSFPHTKHDVCKKRWGSGAKTFPGPVHRRTSLPHYSKSEWGKVRQRLQLCPTLPHLSNLVVGQS